VEIYTVYNQSYRDTFERLKRRSKGVWQFLASGEWSQSPYHQGSHTFHIRHDPKQYYWSLLSIGFPNRVIAVAHTPETQQLEAVAVAMLRAIREDDGDYIDILDSTGEFDRDGFWKSYRAKGNASSPITHG